MKLLRKLSILCFAIIGLLLTLVPVVKTVAQGNQQHASGVDYSTVAWPSKIPRLQQHSEAYRNLLALYVRNIAEISQKKRDTISNEYKRARVIFDNRKKDVDSNEQTILDKLREIRKTREFSFFGDCPERSFLVPSSSASARIWATLLHEGSISPTYLVEELTYLRQHYDQLAPEWIPIVEDAITHRNGRDNNVWKNAVLLLVHCGINIDEYRPMLLDWMNTHDSYASDGLNELLFVRDSATGIMRARKSDANTALVRTLIQQTPSPMVRATCAEYAAEIGETSLAEDVCEQIMWIPFHTRSVGDTTVYNDTDAEISHARLRSMDILFYEISTPEAFEQVYFRAMMASVDQQSIPASFSRYETFPFAEFEITNATMLVRQLDEYNFVGG